MNDSTINHYEEIDTQIESDEKVAKNLAREHRSKAEPTLPIPWRVSTNPISVVVELKILRLEDSKECCSDYISRWIDPTGKHYCQNCIGEIQTAWREVFDRRPTVVDLQAEIDEA